MSNHWDTKCTTPVGAGVCGHRKGSHTMVFGPRISGLKTVGHCVVSMGPGVCFCSGFSDDKTWKNGQRIK